MNPTGIVRIINKTIAGVRETLRERQKRQKQPQSS